MGDIGGHTYGHPLTLRDLDEQLGGAALKVAAEYVAEECVAGKESGPAANGDALGRAGPGRTMTSVMLAAARTASPT